MPKTVKRLDGTVARLSDDEAEKLIKEGKGVYCPKSEWKKLKPKGKPKA